MTKPNHIFAHAVFVLVLSIVSLFASDLDAATPAKKLFGSKALPAALKSNVYGGYTRGCLSGGVGIAIDGPNWQAMRLSRNRRWGHPDLIRVIEQLSTKAKRGGWNGLLVGDISQPRGGPMLTGHRSHQIGLDADIWFTPMPNHRMTYKERENTSAISVLKRGTFYVDDRRWSKAHERLLFNAASFPEVERILVHPGVKKKLCDTVKGNRAWLRKIRPFWGHHYHFHLRIGCPKDAKGCKSQNPPPKGTGCDKTLAWWFKSGLVPKKKKKKKIAKKKDKKKKVKKRRQLVLSDLPKSCEIVLKAASKNKKQAVRSVHALGFSAPEIKIPKLNTTAILKSKPIEARKTDPILRELEGGIAIPTPRPQI